MKDKPIGRIAVPIHPDPFFASLRFRQDILIYFFTRVRIDQPSGCWIWTGAVTKDGYGVILSFDKTKMLAHRVSWIIHNLQNPAPLHVLHNCPDGDNPSCVNPSHLFLGTHAENMADASRKKRFPKTPRARGEANGNSSLTLEQVVKIRELYRPFSYGIPRLAAEFGVSQFAIWSVVTNRTWRTDPQRHEEEDEAE